MVQYAVNVIRINGSIKQHAIILLPH